MLRRIEHGQTREGRRQMNGLAFRHREQLRRQPTDHRGSRTAMPGDCERRTAQPRQNKCHALQAGQQLGGGRRLFVYQVLFSKSHNNHIIIYVVYLKT